MSISLIYTLLLLVVSNCFMLTAWYLHLKLLSDKPWFIAAIISWGVAFFEYSVHIPALRIGSAVLSTYDLHMLQLILSLAVFIPFSTLVLGQPFKTDYFYAGLCLVLAAYFVFRPESLVLSS